MQVRIIAFTQKGARLAQKITRELQGLQAYQVSAYTLEKYAQDVGILSIKGSVKEWSRESFSQSDALVYIGATGIAIRSIAPWIKDKYTDPAVISLDEAGKYVISLLSGHVGGANDLARVIASITKGTPIISTATDVNHLFAVDEWARKKGLKLIGREQAKQFAAHLLEGKRICVETPFEMEGTMPTQLTRTESGDYALAITPYKIENQTGLQVVPPIITLGIGCRRGTSLETIENLVMSTLEALNLRLESVAQVASIDLKQDEQGLIALAEKYQWATQFFTSDELAQLQGEFTPSAFVKAVTQVDNVCERAAVGASKGILIQRKQAQQGVTIAVAQAPFTVQWND